MVDELHPVPQIEKLIYLVDGQRVILDYDLARLYGVTTSNLNKAVRRNQARFPDDFVVTLSPQDAKRLIFQNGISKRGRGGRRKPVLAFTEQGVAMLSSVLHSERAVEVNIAIMRAFVKLRQTLSIHRDLAVKLAELERRITDHDEGIRTLFSAIHQIMNPPETPRRRIGFGVEERRGVYGGS